MNRSVHVRVASREQRALLLPAVVLGYDVEQQPLGALGGPGPLLSQLLSRRYDQLVGEELQAVSCSQQPVVQSE